MPLCRERNRSLPRGACNLKIAAAESRRGGDRSRAKRGANTWWFCVHLGRNPSQLSSIGVAVPTGQCPLQLGGGSQSRRRKHSKGRPLRERNGVVLENSPRLAHHHASKCRVCRRRIETPTKPCRSTAAFPALLKGRKRRPSNASR